ncbi:hypothetical protein DFP72DRAFT_843220 [Ephemerocybe angulata]|uniref:Uncharacterized protein n=1 Tax=Ephemerocybe angulata TaxID=980116 RepID=A0A8H6I8P4_9AGAR|nr:hypothetical protein DFP72DRAFT_843220 [Tulosesus angulatus]
MTKQAPNANCIDPRTHELVQRDAQRTHNIQTLPTHSHKNIVFMKDNEYTKAMQLELGAEERKSWMVWTLEFPHSRSSEGATMKDQRDAQAWPEADPTIPHHQQARDSLDLHIECDAVDARLSKNGATQRPTQRTRTTTTPPTKGDRPNTTVYIQPTSYPQPKEHPITTGLYTMRHEDETRAWMGAACRIWSPVIGLRAGLSVVRQAGGGGGNGGQNGE